MWRSKMDKAVKIIEDIIAIILLLCLPYRLFKLLLGDYCEAEIIKRGNDRLIYQAILEERKHNG